MTRSHIAVVPYDPEHLSVPLSYSRKGLKNGGLASKTSGSVISIRSKDRRYAVASNNLNINASQLIKAHHSRGDDEHR